MISFTEYKRRLGSAADNYSDDELREALRIQEELANILFDLWLEDKKLSKNEDI